MTAVASGNGSHLGEPLTATPLLEVRGCDFAYDTVQVLFGVDLTVAAGELVALVGTNGAGKSTVLRVVAGLAAPTAGTVRFDGADVTGTSAEARARDGLCLISGGHAIFPDLTVAENLEIFGWVMRHDPGQLSQRRATVLDHFPRLADRLDRHAGALSGGEQQQLALAKAFLVRPRLLCIDELSLGLAPIVVETLLSLVRILNDEGTTVVLVEQSLHVAAELCERAVFLEKGAVRFEGSTRTLLARDDIARAVFFGGEVSQ